MNVIAAYAQAKENLSKEEALKISELYMNGLTYEEALDKVKISNIKTQLQDTMTIDNLKSNL